jgi:hypothetical protein
MEESGQICALAASLIRKDSAVHTEYEASWAAKPVWMLWSNENLLPLLGTNYDSPTLQPVAYS